MSENMDKIATKRYRNIIIDKGVFITIYHVLTYKWICATIQTNKSETHQTQNVYIIKTVSFHIIFSIPKTNKLKPNIKLLLKEKLKYWGF